MSMSPSGTAWSQSSLSSAWMRAARMAPRRWTPTIATCSPAFRSTISCAMRTSVRRMSSGPRTAFSSTSPPSWPLGTGLKVRAWTTLPATADVGGGRTLPLCGLEIGMRALIRTAARIAAQHNGVVTRAQLLDAGASHAAIQRSVKTGVLIAVHRGVYRVGHSAPSLLANYTAAVLACGDDAVLGGRAAAYVQRLVRRGKPPPP